jgi:hypothetical protein
LDSGKTNNVQHQGSRRWVFSNLMLIKPSQLQLYHSYSLVIWTRFIISFPHQLLPLQNWTYSNTKKEHQL